MRKDGRSLLFLTNHQQRRSWMYHMQISRVRDWRDGTTSKKANPRDPVVLPKTQADMSAVARIDTMLVKLCSPSEDFW
jgi:hypothetical protein